MKKPKKLRVALQLLLLDNPQLRTQPARVRMLMRRRIMKQFGQTEVALPD